MAVGNRTMEFLITADDSEFQAMTRRVGQRFTELEQSTRTGTAQFMTLGGAVSAFGAGLGALGLASVARDLLAAGMAAQTMTNTMAAATGSITQGAVEMQFVRAEAARLGLDLQNAATDYARLTAAAQGTAIQGEEARRIFSAVAEASVTLGLSADETSGALTAIQQMISKGTVSAEELRGQLGERLPGAFNIAARSMGISTAQLDDMLKKGQVVAGEFLPKFREELLRTFPATASALDSAQANANRFNTALFELKTSIMEQGGLDAFNALASAGSSVVDVLKIGVRWVAESKLAWTTWAKTLGTIMDSGPGFSRWLTAAGRAEISAELDAIQKMDEYSMMKIAERFGNPVRAIGAAQGGAGGGGGSGGRAGNTSKPTSTSRAFFSEAWDRAADELAFEDAQAFVLRVNDLGTGLKLGGDDRVSLLGPVDLLATGPVDMTPAQQRQFDEAASLAEWEARQTESRQRELVAEQEFYAMRDEMSGLSLTAELFRIQQEQDYWTQHWAMMTDSFDEYERRKTTIENYYGDLRIKAAERERQQRLNTVGTMFGGMAQTMLQFYQVSGNKSKEAYGAYKAFAIAETVISTYSSAQKSYDALASIPYVGPALGAAAAAAAIAAGMARVAAISSAEPGTSSVSGGALDYSGGPGTPYNPVVTQPVQTPAQTVTPTFVINIGELRGDRQALQRWLEEEFAPSFRDAVARNVDFALT